jgi:plastocyanin
MEVRRYRAGALLLSVMLLGAWAPMSSAEESLLVQPGADGIQRATIMLDSYAYAPNHVVVQAGKPVELTLHSVTSLTPHNFLITELAAGFRVEQDVGAGKTATVKFTPMQPGTYPFYCDKKLLFFASHREKGMEGRLEVR